MRIVHITQVFSLLSETFIYDYINKLEALGTENYVLTTELDDRHRCFSKVTVLKQSFPVSFRIKYLWSRFQGDAEKLKYLRLASFEKDLERQLTIIKPDVILAHFGPPALFTQQAAEKLGIPIVAAFYGYDISTLLRKPFWLNQYKRRLHRFAALVGISNHICTKIAALAGKNDNIHLVHLGVNPEKFNYTNPADRVKDNTVICLHIGRLVPKKSPIDLLRSFVIAKQLINGKVNLKLKIAGDGPLLGEVEAFVAENDLSSSVEVLGAVKHEDVKQLLQTTHIYTQHSVTGPDGDQEGQGVSLVEASCSGLPVVTTNHNGFSDVVVNGYNGYLVEEFDVEAMGERIAYLAANTSVWSELGINGRRHITLEFNIETEVKKMLQLFSTLVASKK